MMLVIHNGDKITMIRNIGLDFTKDDVIVVPSLPTPEVKEGYSAYLKYNETIGLCYEYVKNPVIPDPVSDDAESEYPTEDVENPTDEVPTDVTE